MQSPDTVRGDKVGGGQVTFKNPFSLPPGTSPHCRDVKFNNDASVSKRYGSTTLNSIVLVSSAATGFTPDTNGNLAVGLQAYWKLNEPGGSRLDEFGGNTLSDVNTVTAAGGRVGDAALFTASQSEYLHLSDNTAVSMGAGVRFSLMGWVYLASTNASQTLLSKYNSNANSVEYAVEYIVATTGRFRFLVSANGTSTTDVRDQATGVPTPNTWYRYLARYDGTNISLQINTNTVVTTAFTADVTNGTAAFTLGTLDQGGSPIQFLDGRQDEVAVWKKALSTQESIDLWAGGTGNTYNKGASNAGYGAFDFGASSLRWLVVSAGTGILASSNRGVTFLTIATDRTVGYQSFERSKNLLLATSESQNRVLYWAGSAGTFMLGLPAGSAPAAKYPLDFGAGYLFLMNYPGAPLSVAYADNNAILTSPWTSTFQVEGSQDDEITGGIGYNKNGYISTKHSMHRVTHVGGNPDFDVKKVEDWGAVPGTMAKATYLDKGEVIIALSWDRKLRVYDGSEALIISTPMEQDNDQAEVFFDGLNVEHLGKCKGVVDTEEQVYRLTVVLQGSVETTHSICLNLRTGALYPYANQNFNALTMANSSNNSRILVGVKRDGFVHHLNTGTTDAGTPIDERLDSAMKHGDSARSIAKGQQLALYFSPTSSGTLYLQDRLDFARAYGPVRDRILLADTTTVTQVQKVVDVPVTHNIYQYRLSSSASTAEPWQLNREEFLVNERGVGRA